MSKSEMMAVARLHVSANATHYSVLRLEETCTQESIVKAYRTLVLSCHPDRVHGKEDKFRRLREAYTCLMEHREAYDGALAEVRSPVAFDGEVISDYSVEEVEEVDDDGREREAILWSATCRCGEVLECMEENEGDVVECLGCGLKYKFERRRLLRREGPATSLLPDQFLRHLTSPSDTVHGLVIVANWPPPLDQLSGPYARLSSLLASAFGNNPCLFQQPEDHLHVTITTVHAFTNPEGLTWSEKERAEHSEKARTELDGVNGRAIKVRASSINVGERACIILWEDVSDGAVSALRHQLKEKFDSWPHLAVPNIIHSTIARYHPGCEDIDISDVHNFLSEHQTEVDEILESFGTVELKDIKLVRETRPYMHVPNDESHTLRVVNLN